MRDEMIERAILKVLYRMPGVHLRQATLAAEVEIAADRLLTTAEFTDALRALEDRRLVFREVTALDEVTWSISGRGAEALGRMGGEH